METCGAEKLESLCDYFFQIERDITPELALGGRLRPFVHCWMGAQLRFCQERAIRFGKENSLVDRLRRGVARAGLADKDPRAVDAWLRDNSEIVVAHFNERNIQIALPFGGAGIGGLEPLVASITNLSNIIFTQGEILELISSFDYIFKQ